MPWRSIHFALAPGTVNHLVFAHLTEMHWVYVEPNVFCLYTKSMPTFLAQNGFPSHKLQGVIS